MNKSLNSFLQTAFYPQNEVPESKLSGQPVSPEKLDWGKYGKDKDKSKAGKYTYNPELQNVDLSTLTIAIEKLPNKLIGKKLEEVGEFIAKKYSKKYYIPGVELWQYITENPGEVPKQLRKTNQYYYLFGSVLCHPLGDWYVPHLEWGLVYRSKLGGKFFNSADWLGGTWRGNWIVLLKKN